MRMRTTRKRKKTNGSRVLAGLLCALALGAAGQKNASYAIVEGTVFRDPGLAVLDAKVTIEETGGKKKKQETATNARGEFLFRVPAVEASYVVRASMKGYRSEEKEAKVAGGAAPGQERVEVNLVLTAAGK